MASPERFTFRMAWLRSTVGFQPDIVPSSVTKIKKAFAPGFTLNAIVKLNTFPVGVAGPLCPLGTGIVTTRLCGMPLASYRVERPVPLSETHQGDPEERDSPHAFTKLGSRLGTLATLAELAVKSVRSRCCPKALQATSVIKIVSATARAGRFRSPDWRTGGSCHW